MTSASSDINGDGNGKAIAIDSQQAGVGYLVRKLWDISVHVVLSPHKQHGDHRFKCTSLVSPGMCNAKI